MRCRPVHIALFSFVAATLVSQFCDARSASATLVPQVIYSQNFNAGLPGAGFGTGGAGTVTGVAGTAQLVDGAGDLSYYTTTTFTGEQFTFLADVNQLNGSVGGATSGIVVGNRAYTFFGGFSGGAFNILNVNVATAGILGTVLGDTNMGYTPLQNNRQHFQITVVPATLPNYNISVQISNLDGPGSFLYNYVDSSFAPGSVGFFNWSSDHTTQYDNLQVLGLREVPEPSTLALLGLGAIGLAVKTRRRGK